MNKNAPAAGVAAGVARALNDDAALARRLAAVAERAGLVGSPLHRRWEAAAGALLRDRLDVIHAAAETEAGAINEAANRDSGATPWPLAWRAAHTHIAALQADADAIARGAAPPRTAGSGEMVSPLPPTAKLPSV